MKWKERLFDFLLGVILSGAISTATIYNRVVALESRLASVENTLHTITEVRVKP